MQERSNYMQTLNEIAQKYLEENGIKHKYFADYIGVDYVKCTRWLKGEKKLASFQIQRVHEFLSGEFLKTIDEIIKGE